MIRLSLTSTVERLCMLWLERSATSPTQRENPQERYAKSMLRSSFNIFLSVDYPEGGGCLVPVTNEMFSTYALAVEWIHNHGKDEVEYIVTNVVGENMPARDVDEPERVSRRGLSHKPAVKARHVSQPRLSPHAARRGKVL